MLNLILWLLFIAGILCGFIFSKTTKEFPKSWYEWKTEFRYQYVGIAGLIHDALYASRDRVSLYKQPDCIAVITGGNRGIGLRIVEKLLACDMTVIMGVRDPNCAKRAVSSIVDLSKSNGKLVCETLDVGDLTSVKEFAQKIKTKYNKIDILINNGIMFAPFKLTADGFESHFAINYLGHFLLTHLLLPELRTAGKEGKNARIVNVSSCVNLIGHIYYQDINGLKNYYPGTAYSQSKLAQILSTRSLQRLLESEPNTHVQVNVVHPGIVDTDLFEHSATTSVPFLKKAFFKTPERGSRTVVYAAIAPAIEGVGGTYLSNCGKGPMHSDAKNMKKCEEFFKFSCNLLKIRNYGNGEI